MKKYIFSVGLVVISILFALSKNSTVMAAAGNIFTKISSIAIRDPFYPDYPQRRILVSTTNLSWWGTPGLNRYTLTSVDPRVGNKVITFYSAGYALCPNGLEMSLPNGTAPGSAYSHAVCSLTSSDDFNFLFPTRSVTTAQTVLDSPATMTGDGNLNIMVYVPLNWWAQ